MQILGFFCWHGAPSCDMRIWPWQGDLSRTVRTLAVTGERAASIIADSIDANKIFRHIWTSVCAVFVLSRSHSCANSQPAIPDNHADSATKWPFSAFWYGFESTHQGALAQGVRHPRHARGQGGQRSPAALALALHGLLAPAQRLFVAFRYGACFSETGSMGKC